MTRRITWTKTGTATKTTKTKTEKYDAVRAVSRLSFPEKGAILSSLTFSAMFYEEKYPHGLQMTQFEHNWIGQISEYNHNYYVGFGKDLLLANSDDDTTEWFLAHNETFRYLGESKCSRGELLIRYEQPCT
jgi:hypothetical protein